MRSEQAKRLRNAFVEALTPPPSLLVSEWARAKFRLSSEYSSATGCFEPYPYQIEPLDALSAQRTADTVVLMCGAQMMKTLTMLIFLGFVIDTDPGPALIVQPSGDDADAFSKERIAPMVRDVPVVAAKVVEAKSRDTGNTILQKRFRGGYVSLTGSISPRGLRRRSVRYLLCDEIDGYVDTSDGDPLSLAAARTSKYSNRKILLCSTPTIEGRSRIWSAYEASDQRRFFVPCPLCGVMQQLEWERVRWGDVEGVQVAPENAVYQCVGCNGLIQHHHKWAMLRAGEWRALNPEGKYPGFGISRLYAPDWSWGRIVIDPLEGFLQAKGDDSRHQAFKNNVLAELWREPGEAPPDYEVLMGRRETYSLGEVPNGVLFLTAGVDVQKTWLEGYVWGWGRGKQRWLIDWWRIEHAPFDATAWVELSERLNTSYLRADHAELNIVRMCVDSGYAGNEVYKFAQTHPGRVMAVDGRDKGAAIVSTPSQVEITVGGRKVRRGVKLWPVNVSMCKHELYGQLQKERPKDGDPFPAGWVHFPLDATEDFFTQLVSEEFRSEVVNGIRKFRWSPIENRRHESLDCANYARAGAFAFGMDRSAFESQWEKLESSSGVVAASNPAPTPKPETQPLAPPRQSGFWNRKAPARSSYWSRS